jgi:hypothetical protein
MTSNGILLAIGYYCYCYCYYYCYYCYYYYYYCYYSCYCYCRYWTLTTPCQPKTPPHTLYCLTEKIALAAA